MKLLGILSFFLISCHSVTASYTRALHDSNNSAYNNTHRMPPDRLSTLYALWILPNTFLSLFNSSYHPLTKIEKNVPHSLEKKFIKLYATKNSSKQAGDKRRHERNSRQNGRNYRRNHHR